VTDDTTAEQIERAARAMQAYAQAAFPDEPSLLERGPLHTRSVLTALVRDLEHYATQNGLTFTGSVSGVPPRDTAQDGDQAAFEVGDQVQLTHHLDRCGTIIGWETTDPDGETTYIVEVPGLPYLHAETPTRLVPAPPFPATPTSQGAVTRADQAEQTYIDLIARLKEAAEPARHALEQDCRNLLNTLSDWSGISYTQLRTELTTRHRPSRGRSVAPHAPGRPPARRPETRNVTTRACVHRPQASGKGSDRPRER